MLDTRVKHLLAAPLDALAEIAIRARLSANMVTLIGFGLGLLGVGFVALDTLPLGALFLALNRLADGVDGAVARKTKTTALGAYLDTVLTYFIFAGLAFSFVAARQQFGLSGGFLLFSLFLVAVTDLATRSFQGANAREEDKGAFTSFLLVKKTWTSGFYLIVLLQPFMFAFLPYPFGALCLLTAAVRIATAVAALSSSARP